MTLPNALLKATLSDTRTRVLQAPQLRTVDNVTAELKIGQREPTASGSYQPGTAGVGVNPLVNTQFTYIDVGVNVKLLAHVHDNGDISLHIELEISNIANTVSLGGIDEPIIGQRKVTHDIRLREGEVNLIAGLISSTNSKSVTGIPGLSSIPFLGKLFSGDSVDRERDEVMMAIIPHVIRKPVITVGNLRAMGVGNQTVVKLNYAPETQTDLGAAQPTPRAETASTGASTALPPATASPTGASRIPAAVRFSPAQIDTADSSVFTVALAVDNATDLASAQLQIQFDPKVLRLNDVSPGGLLAVDGQRPEPVKNVRNDAGSATVEILRTPGSAGVSASGNLVTLRFQAIARGTATITIPTLALRNSRGQITADDSPSVSVNVR